MPNKVIVVIDDELDTVDFLNAALSRRGYEVVGALNAETGLQLIRERQPAVAMVDLMMPSISGYDVCRQLRADPQTVQLPIIVLTASGMLSAERDALAAGADQFILKPVGLKLLTETIEAVQAGKQTCD